jgi:hypothetical protein
LISLTAGYDDRKRRYQLLLERFYARLGQQGSSISASIEESDANTAGLEQVLGSVQKIEELEHPFKYKHSRHYPTAETAAEHTLLLASRK